MKWPTAVMRLSFAPVESTPDLSAWMTIERSLTILKGAPFSPERSAT